MMMSPCTLDGPVRLFYIFFLLVLPVTRSTNSLIVYISTLRHRSPSHCIRIRHTPAHRQSTTRVTIPNHVLPPARPKNGKEIVECTNTPLSCLSSFSMSHLLFVCVGLVSIHSDEQPLSPTTTRHQQHQRGPPRFLAQTIHLLPSQSAYHVHGPCTH
jgi:hypothetical protein